MPSSRVSHDGHLFLHPGTTRPSAADVMMGAHYHLHIFHYHPPFYFTPPNAAAATGIALPSILSRLPSTTDPNSDQSLCAYHVVLHPPTRHGSTVLVTVAPLVLFGDSRKTLSYSPLPSVSHHPRAACMLGGNLVHVTTVPPGFPIISIILAVPVESTQWAVPFGRRGAHLPLVYRTTHPGLIVELQRYLLPPSDRRPSIHQFLLQPYPRRCLSRTRFRETLLLRRQHVITNLHSRLAACHTMYPLLPYRSNRRTSSSA